MRAALALLVASGLVVAAAPERDRRDFSTYETVETHRIRITNTTGGPIEISPDEGESWLQVGSVTRPAHSLSDGYAATRWSRDGTVCATAVHGLRIRVDQWESSDRGAVFALVPKEFANPPPGFGGFDPGASGIYTDIRAGTSIFRGLAPFVGNQVYLAASDGSTRRLPGRYEPQIGDRIVIEVRQPTCPPVSFTFQNRDGGRATAEFVDGSEVLLGRVTRPLRGVGRFDATGYTGVGCINTNHSGVITISTAPDNNGEPLFDAPFGETRGGFMIQPSTHAQNEGWPIDQVLVVAPPTDDSPPLEGRAPLFAGFLGLAFQSRDPDASYLCTMSIDGGPWEPLPEYVGRSESLFTARGLERYYSDLGRPHNVTRGLTGLRITFPKELSGQEASTGSWKSLALVPAGESHAGKGPEWGTRAGVSDEPGRPDS